MSDSERDINDELTTWKTYFQSRIINGVTCIIHVMIIKSSTKDFYFARCFPRIHVFGVVKMGNIDAELVGKVITQLELPDVKQRLQRQTDFKWNSACDIIFVET